MMASDESEVDVPRLRQTLGQSGFNWLVSKLKNRMESGNPFPKSMSHSHPTSEEIEAFQRFFGKTGSRSTVLKISLVELASRLRESGITHSLERAVEELVGPVVNRKIVKEQEEQEWLKLYQSMEPLFSDDPVKLDWIQRIFKDHTLVRLTGKNIDGAKALLLQARKVIDLLPAKDISLAQLAAETTGNAHALDRGEKLGQLMIRFAAAMGRLESWKLEEERRQAWEHVGVLCDQLSAPALVWNLRIAGASFTNRNLYEHAIAGLPCRLMTQHLTQNPLECEFIPASKTIFVCENPSVIQAVSNLWAKSTAPLICTEGPLKTATRILLDQLSQMGFIFRYHGDFEWKGIQMANSFLERYPMSSPWRLFTEDYLQIQGDHPLEGTSVEARWDSQLTETMKKKKYSLFEEQVLSWLMEDLCQDGNP